MRTAFGVLVSLSLCLVLAAGALAADLTDPYEILHRHFEAVGGLERARDERTSYSEGSIEIVGTGLQGTFRSWGQFPTYSRQELDLTIVTQTSGDNGEFGWLVDQNGKIRIQKDEATMERREIADRAAAYDYLDPDSETFGLSLEGIEKSGEVDCYVLRLTNTINDDVTRLFYDTEGFLLQRKEDIEPDQERHSTFGDYREVDGFRVAFRQETEILPIGQRIVVELTEYRSNLEIDPMLFEPPGEDVKDFTFTDGASSAEIPFEFIETHIYLMVTVGGKEGRWVLDSGASSTVVDRAFARELGLEIEGEIKGRGVSQTVDVSFVTLPPLSIETLSLAEQKVVTIDIGWLFRKTMGADFEVVGILGYDFLSRFVTRVDYAAQRSRRERAVVPLSVRGRAGIAGSRGGGDGRVRRRGFDEGSDGGVRLGRVRGLHHREAADRRDSGKGRGRVRPRGDDRKSGQPSLPALRALPRLRPPADHRRERSRLRHRVPQDEVGTPGRPLR
jgi:hypothetical protein